MPYPKVTEKQARTIAQAFGGWLVEDLRGHRDMVVVGFPHGTHDERNLFMAGLRLARMEAVNPGLAEAVAIAIGAVSKPPEWLTPYRFTATWWPTPNGQVLVLPFYVAEKMQNQPTWVSLESEWAVPGTGS